MALTLLPGYRILDDNGNPVSGGKLYVFEAGTSNPRDVYTDSALTTPHAHPVVADAGGLLPDIWTAEDELKLRVTDASDVTIWELDDYSTGGTGSGSGGDVTRTPLSKTANYTVTAADENAIIVMDASGIAGLQGDVTGDAETLGAGFVIGVKNIGATGNVLFQGTGSQTIDGAANRSLTTQYEFMDLVSRGAAGWFVLASQGASDVTVTVRQADASTDGTLTFENELGVRRWAQHHINTIDDFTLYRFDSGGNFVDTVYRAYEANGNFEVFNLFVSASGRVNISRATTSGTYNKPTAANYLGTVVKLYGSGGRGGDDSDPLGGGGGGGGGGGYCEKWYADADLSASESYTILASNAGTGNSTFKSLLAGAGANTPTGVGAKTGAAGGSASGGDINVAGETAQNGYDGTDRTGGAGGGSYGHSGGAGGHATGGGGTLEEQVGQDGYGPGAGGGGGGDSTRADGAAGEITFIEYFS